MAARTDQHGQGRRAARPQIDTAAAAGKPTAETSSARGREDDAPAPPLAVLGALGARGDGSMDH